jgi:hypothetical protein
MQDRMDELQQWTTLLNIDRFSYNQIERCIQNANQPIVAHGRDEIIAHNNLSCKWTTFFTAIVAMHSEDNEIPSCLSNRDYVLA